MTLGGPISVGTAGSLIGAVGSLLGAVNWQVSDPASSLGHRRPRGRQILRPLVHLLHGPQLVPRPARRVGHRSGRCAGRSAGPAGEGLTGPLDKSTARRLGRAVCRVPPYRPQECWAASWREVGAGPVPVSTSLASPELLASDLSGPRCPPVLIC